jgi:N-acetylglutamate synthase-like GNAT family acetyltransferase
MEIAPRSLVRQARASDLTPLVAFADRCTPGTLYRRFHGATPGVVHRELERIASPSSRHRSWVATDADGAVRGTATLAWDAQGTAEVAFLVEDAWFRRGIGRALMGCLAADARRAGAETVVAWIQADNDRAARFLRATAPGARYELSGGELRVTVPLHRARAMPAADQEAA